MNVANRLLYGGQLYDPEIDQYYLRARYYNPVIGRFTQEDPDRGDGLNLYAYCANNPVIYYDPSGYSNYEIDGRAEANVRKGNVTADEMGNETPTQNADLENKLDYQFGKAGGGKHNVDRTNGLYNEMEKLGFEDTIENHEYFQQYYNNVLNDSTNIAGVELKSYIAKELPDQPRIFYDATYRESLAPV